MGPMVIVVLGLAAASAIAVLVGAASCLLVPLRQALRVAAAAMIGGAIGFIATALGQMPLYPQSAHATASLVTYLGTAGVAGLVAALIAAGMILKLGLRKP